MTEDIQTIERAEITTKLDAGTPVVLVEALPEENYEDAHLPGAINVPHDRVDELAPQLLSDKDSEIVVYCANEPCKNSTIASRRLLQLGYQRVREYVGGKQDWMEAGLPVERGRANAA